MPIVRVKPGVVRVEPRKLNISERLYLPRIVAGMFLTLRHLLYNLFKISLVACSESHAASLGSKGLCNGLAQSLACPCHKHHFLL